MQERYLGDVHDFVKYAYMRHVHQSTGWRMGLSWYLANPRSVDHPQNNDGEQRYHLASGDWASVDPDLLSALHQFRDPARRSLSVFERSGILPASTLFASAPVASKQERAAWHRGCIGALSGPDFVFLDPDNGLQVPSMTPKTMPKYALFDEFQNYAEKFKMVTVIQFARQCDPVKRAEEVCSRVEEATDLQITLPILRARVAPNLLFISHCQPQHKAMAESMICAFAAKSTKLELIYRSF